MKNKRQEKILEIIAKKKIANQSQLARELNSRGFKVTQATISRDLDELKVTKVKALEGKNFYYAVPKERSKKIGISLKRCFEDYVVSMEKSGNLVLVRTLPGNAQGVAALLDEANFSEILGTVAGDDTILVVARENILGKKILQILGDIGK